MPESIIKANNMSTLNGNTAPSIPDGTSSNPSLNFINEAGTGLFRESDGNIGISIKGLKIGNITNFGITLNQPYWNIVDQKTPGTPGGTFTQAAWQTRTLNTTIGSNTITGSSLLNNQFTLPSGTYRINVSAPAYTVNRHKAKLRNITDSSDTLIGTSEYNAPSTGTVVTSSLIKGIFTITSSKVFEIQHQCQTTSGATNGFGVESNFGVVEIYTQVEIWKIG